jgi:hypothetical protein
MEAIRMSVEGSISVAVDFNDTSDGEGVDTLKKIRLASIDTYTTGKVAVVSGTCGTALVVISGAPSSYEDASGSAVNFTSGITRVAFSSSDGAVLEAESASPFSDLLVRLHSQQDRVCVTDTLGAIQSVGVKAQLSSPKTGDVSDYTIILYGS